MVIHLSLLPDASEGPCCNRGWASGTDVVLHRNTCRMHVGPLFPAVRFGQDLADEPSTGQGRTFFFKFCLEHAGQSFLWDLERRYREAWRGYQTWPDGNESQSNHSQIFLISLVSLDLSHSSPTSCPCCSSLSHSWTCICRSTHGRVKPQLDTTIHRHLNLQHHHCSHQREMYVHKEGNGFELPLEDQVNTSSTETGGITCVSFHARKKLRDT